jgi:hypothetical protein
MCSVSFIGGTGYDKWYPNLPSQPTPYIYPPTITVTTPEPTPEQWAQLMELVRKARLYDQLTDKKDCVKPDVDAWLLEIEERLGKLEEDNKENLAADQLAEALRIGLGALGFSLEGFEEEL